ncbi:MAG: hypothetical protein D3915_12440 [Candidatus Electrothrix sp. AU1_5]|nr:hypothetical protein [Candidatus Electrothrix gigas]MCI5226120.1 hypothetical protein [Candidatus Electrothrix gigas]
MKQRPASPPKKIKQVQALCIKDQQNSPYFAKNQKVWYSAYLLPMVIFNMYSICSQPEFL